MGRLNRYRKIKSCDPFYKGPKKDTTASLSKFSQKSKKLSDEQEIPRAARDLLKSQQAMKNHSSSKEKRRKKRQKEQGSTKFQRIHGESQKTYFDRIDHEAAVEVAESLKESRNIRDGRKKHLKERKDKKKEKKKSFENVANFDSMKDNVRFGEVVMEPPRLTAKPRKAPQTNKGAKSLLLHALATQSTETASHKIVETKAQNISELPKTKKRKHMSALEQERADKQREHAIMAYRQMRKQQLQEKNEPT